MSPRARKAPSAGSGRRALGASLALACATAEQKFTNATAFAGGHSADVARIQADADLAYARGALRLDAGRLGNP